MGEIADRSPETDIAAPSVPDSVPAGLRALIAQRQATVDMDARALFPVSPSVGTVPRLRRLSRLQYLKSIRALFNEEAGVGALLPDEGDETAFDNDARLLAVEEQRLVKFEAAAQALAIHVERNLAKLSLCATTDRPCLRAYALKLSERAFRRPLPPEQDQRLGQLFDDQLAEGAARAVSAVVEYLFQSPRFLYRVQATPFDAWMIAEQLAFLLTNGPPDATLLELARSGRLADREVAAAEVNRLVASPAYVEVFQDFQAQSLHYRDLLTQEKAAQVFPEFDQTMRRDLLADGRRVVTDAFASEANFVSMMTDARVPSAGAAAKLYAGDPRDGVLSAVRSGPLTAPAFLASASTEETRPMNRASTVLAKFLCLEVVEPKSIPPIEESFKGGPVPRTVRGQFGVHSTQPGCASCHHLLDPVAFVLESYDPLGRHRTSDHGEPIDPAGSLNAGTFPLGAFAHAAELGRTMALNQSVHGCMVQRLFHYLGGRAATDDDNRLLAGAYRRFVASGYDLRELVKGLIVSDTFLRR